MKFTVGILMAIGLATSMSYAQEGQSKLSVEEALKNKNSVRMDASPILSSKLRPDPSLATPSNLISTCRSTGGQSFGSANAQSRQPAAPESNFARWIDQFALQAVVQFRAEFFNWCALVYALSSDCRRKGKQKAYGQKLRNFKPADLLRPDLSAGADANAFIG